MTSVMMLPPAAERLTEFNSPVYAPSRVTLMWQSPSCSTWCEATLPVTLRHGLEPSRTVSSPGRCTPWSGLAGSRLR